MSSSPPIQVSLFSELIDTLGDDAPIIRCTKPTLVHISHQLEDLVLRHQLPAMLFTGFQESSHWQQETARYRELAQMALQVTIFAGEPLPKESSASQLHVELKGEDPLRQEWFLLILSPQFSVLLCGQDNLKPTEDENTREFDTIWSFDIDLITRTLDRLEDVIAEYRPDRIDALREARRQYPPQTITPHLMAELMLNIVQFEERLNAQLRWQQTLTDTMLSTVPHHLYVLEYDDKQGLRVLYESPNITYIIDTDDAPSPHTLRIFDAAYLHPNDTNVVAGHLQHIKNGEDSVAEFRVRISEDDTLWVRDHIISDKQTDTVRLYGVMEDITMRKQLENERRENDRLHMLLEQEREYGRLKARFTEVVSHEFRSPLASVSTTLYMLKRTREQMSKDQYEARLNRIQQSVDALTRLMDEYMIVVGDEFGSYSFNPVSLRLSELIQSLVENNKGQHSRGQQLHVDAPDNDLVNIDPELVRLILTSLLSNAYRYTDADALIEVTARVEGDNVVLVVADNGPGIPADKRERIFEAFYRTTEAQQAMPGLGLGLSVVRRAVGLHSGQVTVQQREEGGTIFTVTLPTTPN